MLSLSFFTENLSFCALTGDSVALGERGGRDGLLRTGVDGADSLPRLPREGQFGEKRYSLLRVNHPLLPPARLLKPLRVCPSLLPLFPLFSPSPSAFQAKFSCPPYGTLTILHVDSHYPKTNPRPIQPKRSDEPHFRKIQKVASSKANAPREVAGPDDPSFRTTLHPASAGSRPSPQESRPPSPYSLPPHLEELRS